MRNSILYIFILFSLTTTLYAREKAKGEVPVKTLLKNARTSIKHKRDQQRNEATLEEALKRKDLTLSERASIRQMQAMLNLSLNDGENLKAYLKQSYDTVAYFNTLLKASQYAMMSDTLDTLPNERGLIKPTHRRKNKEILMRCRANLYAGGRFFLRKQENGKALPYLITYLEMVHLPLLTSETSLAQDTNMVRARFYATLAAYNSQQHRTALHYIDKTIESADSSAKSDLQEYKVRSLLAIGDSVQWLAELKRGCQLYPKHDYFFTNIEEYYEDYRLYDKGIELADSMLTHVQDIPLYWYAKSLMHLHKEQWYACIAMCDSTLRRDSVHIDALYNRGISYVNLAMEYAETACHDMRIAKCRKDRERITQFYAQALPSFERLKRLQPDAPQRWAPILYRIYLNLNRGKEFSEMEQILKQIAS